jgi:hypothetical protein
MLILMLTGTCLVSIRVKCCWFYLKNKPFELEFWYFNQEICSLCSQAAQNHQNEAL